MHTDSKYALFFQPDATRSAINAMDGLAATNALVAFASASDELQRYAYLRKLLVQHNAPSPFTRSTLQRLTKPEEKPGSDGDDAAMQLTVGYNGEVQRRKVKKTKQTFEEKFLSVSMRVLRSSWALQRHRQIRGSQKASVGSAQSIYPV